MKFIRDIKALLNRDIVTNSRYNIQAKELPGINE